MGDIRHIPFTIFIFCFLLGMGRESFGQDPDKPDLRESCGICKGKANNYSILNVYFSDSEGLPKIVCGDTEETLYISVLYSSNSNKAIHNVRLIADIEKKDINNPEGAPLSEFYINEFFGTVNPCPDGTCIFSIPLPIDFKIDCENEFYELSQPLVAWTPNAGDNLIDSYDCQDYPNAQCLNQPTILIDVGDLLIYTFEPFFDCFSGDINQTNVSYVLTSLFGGNPTLPYTLDWKFKFSDVDSLLSTDFNPVLLNRGSGSIIDAYLTISQGSISGDTIFQRDTVPLGLPFGEVIQDFETVDTDEGESNGIIDVTFLEKDLFYFWKSLEDSLFYSQDARIDSLSVGTYELTTINNETGTCRTDLFDINARILPVEYVYTRTNYNSKARTSLISWATGKERKSSHFEIERSTETVNDFKKIGEVNAAGWSDIITEYNFEDRDLPLSASTILYRIKQVDINKTYAYSDVMSVRTPQVEATKGVWRAYPNPTNGEKLRIGLLDNSHYKSEKISFRLLHTALQSPMITVASVAEVNAALATMIDQFPKGVFVIEILWGQKVEHIKVLKP